MVRAATLESQLSVEELDVLPGPLELDSSPEDDPYLRCFVQNFIDLMGCSQDTYSNVCQNVLELFPNAPVLSYDQVKRRVQKLSGVVTWEHHMCVNGCVGFTSPFAELKTCPTCGKHCYDQKKLEVTDGIVKEPCKIFTTFPVGVGK